MRTKDEAIDHFEYHPPTEETLPKHQKVTAIFINVVDKIWDVVPDGPGKTLALRKLSEARMAFNSAIANNGQ
jgi:hypothetical protein